MMTALFQGRLRRSRGWLVLYWAASIACAMASIVVPHDAIGQPPPSNLAAPAATPVIQFNGTETQLPAKFPFSRRSGLRLRVDPRWTNNYGYRPVEVEISSPKPTTSDHLITIQLHAGYNRNISVEQVFEMPAGSTKATTHVSLPVYQAPVNNFWWDLWVDGVKDKDLSIDRNSPQAWMSSANGSGSNLTFLVAGSNNTNRTLVSTNALELEVLSLNLAEFPTRWIDYTAIDVVSLSLSEVQQLAKQSPTTFDAIRQWVAAGGQLWVSDIGAELEHLPEVSKVFQISETLVPIESENARDAKQRTTADESADKPTEQSTPSTDNNADPGDKDVKAADSAAKADGAEKNIDGKADTPTKPKAEPQEEDLEEHKVQSGWQALRFRRGGTEGQVVTFLDMRTGTRRTVRDPEVIARLQNDANLVTAEQRFEAGDNVPSRRFVGDSNPWFVEQSLGLGHVRAFRGANEAAQFPLTPAPVNPNAVANSDAPDQLPRALAMGLRRTQRWDSRHGMTPDSANTEFAKFLVPGVGLAPVTEFRVLITLFVLLIGPVNYWFLKRFKRLHLMVLTVPLAAIVTTAALFGYAIVADGFDSRVRAQSFTTLDQQTGEAACWTRLSYYSGLAPGKGLTMPADLVMYPILPSWAGDADLAEEKDLAWDGDQALLTKGWLISRTPTQYLTVRSRKSPYRLEVLDSGDKLRVKNQLGTKINTLIVVSEGDRLYFGEDIANGASASLRLIERDDAIRRLNRQIVAHAPQAPDALASGDTEIATMRSRSRYSAFGRSGLQYNPGKLSENLQGEALINLAGLGGQPALALPPRTYVAITETGPEVETGISYAKEEASFHVIMGKW